MTGRLFSYTFAKNRGCHTVQFISVSPGYQDVRNNHEDDMRRSASSSVRRQKLVGSQPESGREVPRAVDVRLLTHEQNGVHQLGEVANVSQANFHHPVVLVRDEADLGVGILGRPQLHQSKKSIVTAKEVERSGEVGGSRTARRIDQKHDICISGTGYNV